jgi:putative transposase
MHRTGIQGARRGRRFLTTKADASAARPPDLVRREFSATAPNRLWVVDFTYVPTWSGMAFTAAPARRSGSSRSASAHPVAWLASA